MMFRNPSTDEIRQLLQAIKTIAVVGFSNRPHRPSHGVAYAMQQAGYRTVSHPWVFSRAPDVAVIETNPSQSFASFSAANTMSSRSRSDSAGAEMPPP